MVLCGRGKNMKNSENMETAEPGCDGTYRSYRVDDVFLNGDDNCEFQLEEVFINPAFEDSSEEQNTASTSSGISFSNQTPRRKSLILNVPDLAARVDQMNQFDFNFKLESPSEAKHEQKTPFFSNLINFFSNIICRSRPVLTFGSNVTISTIKEISSRTFESENPNEDSFDSFNSDSRGEHDFRKNYGNNSRSLEQGSRLLKRTQSLPNIKFKNYELKSNYSEENDILIVYSKIESTDETEETPALCAAVILKTLETHGYFFKCKRAAADFVPPLIKITQIENTKVAEKNDFESETVEKSCFLVQIPKKNHYFLKKKPGGNLTPLNRKNTFLIQEKVISRIKLPVVSETHFTVDIRRLFDEKTELAELETEYDDNKFPEKEKKKKTVI